MTGMINFVQHLPMEPESVVGLHIHVHKEKHNDS